MYLAAQLSPGLAETLVVTELRPISPTLITILFEWRLICFSSKIVVLSDEDGSGKSIEQPIYK